ncbi:MAG: hypothetical protein AAFO07_02195 [Bacteroidota bacterium]
MKYITSFFLILFFSFTAFAQNLELDIQKDGVLLLEGGDTILFYQTAGLTILSHNTNPGYPNP